LVQTSGKSITQIARELGISDSAIHNWRKELTEHGKEAFPGKGHQTALEEENRHLKVTTQVPHAMGKGVPAKTAAMAPSIE
jgi:transposase